MDDCTYNKNKLLKEINKLAGFIKKYAKKDAKAAKHTGCGKFMTYLHNDLTKHMKQLKDLKKKKNK